MSTIDEPTRHDLYQALERSLGPEPAGTLMSMLPPQGWADVVRRHDLEHATVSLRTDLEHATVALRGDLALVRADLEHEVQRLDTKIDALGERLDTKIDGLGERLDAKIDGLEERMCTRMDALRFEVIGHIDRTSRDQMRVWIFSLIGALAAHSAVIVGAMGVMG